MFIELARVKGIPEGRAGCGGNFVHPRAGKRPGRRRGNCRNREGPSRRGRSRRDSLAGLDRAIEAIDAFQSAIAWQSEAPVKNPDPYINLGGILIEQNRPAEAVKYLGQAIAIPAESYRAQGMEELQPRAHEHLAKAYSRLNQLPKAETELEKALELTPNDAHLHYELAQIYQREGLSEKAKSEFDRYTTLSAETARSPNR